MELGLYLVHPNAPVAVAYALSGILLTVFGHFATILAQ